MEIVWEVEDGYCGKSRPQRFFFDTEGMEGMTADEIMDEIADAVQENFEQKITWYISNLDRVKNDVQEFVERQQPERE